MSQISVKLSILGVDALLDKLKDPEKVMGKAIPKATIALHGTIKSVTPVDTGQLRKNMKFSWDTGAIPAWGKVTNSLDHAPFVEFGTKYMEARHVSPGSSVRVMGTGPLAKGAELSQGEIEKVIKQTEKDIENGFG